MIVKTQQIEAPRTGRSYMALIRRFPLVSIRSDDALVEASDLAGELMARVDMDTDEDDYLDILSGLIARYEAEAHPLPPVSDADMLRHLIDSRAVTQAAVSAGSGVDAPTLSAILAGNRTLNRRHIAGLSRHFKVDPAVFIGD